jgi:hypothetical protein
MPPSWQYCKHGTFVGHPWGPDHICGKCEDGEPADDESRPDVADRLVEAIHAAAKRRADNDDAYYWTSHDSYRRFVVVLRGVKAKRVGEREVIVTAPDTPDGRLWGYVAGDVIDAACEEVDPTGEITFKTGYIDPVIDRQRYRFTW